MPMSHDEAFNATNPSMTDEQRETSARAIMLGVAANDVYWNHRSDLEALRARVEGHGQVVRGPDEQSPIAIASPTGGTGPATLEPADTVDSTATDQSETAIGPGDAETDDATGSPPPPPNPDNPTEAVAKLREQLRQAGYEPEA